jgi:hypothetical protein
MTRSFRTGLMVGLSTIACVVTLAACGSSTPSGSSQGTQTGGTPGPADSRICQVVTQATAAYNAKQYTTWRNDMALIGQSADSAQYTPLKNYAEEIKQATSSATTTTKPNSRRAKASGVHVGGLFGELGGYVGLQRVCAKLPS